MTVNIEIDEVKDVKVPDFDYETIIKNTVNAALDYEKCPYDAEVSVLLTNNEVIREINKENRNIDRATDVLSFPNNDFPAPSDFSKLEDEWEGAFNPETGELLLGDIVISTDKVYEQAESFGHSPKRELAFLVAHSMLHLFGYDHMEDSERVVMEEKQDEILNSIGYTRDF